ncbi:hypothetical protein L3Y34_013246 [Caenorhabditis briggsae]|uniref:Uncharacterized protein n=1 Tax=Caenorhabditis briggsae TaxID=6238 RepID=A0AAE9CWU0_CAEBR|nr:hypothetical protein L3Y34_013246 [Caenorhabditis briggsae]
MLQEFDESTENFVSAVIAALEKHKKVEEIKDLRRYVLQRNVEANIEKYASWRVDQVRAQRRMIRITYQF